MNYRDFLDHHKQSHIDAARNGGYRMSEVHHWDLTRANTAQTLYRLIGSTVEGIPTHEDPQLQCISDTIRKDLFGVTNDGVLHHQAQDVVDAGPEHLLVVAMQSDMSVDDMRFGMRLCTLNTLYKTAKWERVSQMQNLLQAIETLEEWEKRDFLQELMILQTTVAYYQSCLETDIETKPHLRYHHSIQVLLDQFAALENMHLPFELHAVGGNEESESESD